MVSSKEKQKKKDFKGTGLERLALTDKEKAREKEKALKQRDKQKKKDFKGTGFEGLALTDKEKARGKEKALKDLKAGKGSGRSPMKQLLKKSSDR
jgi:hypothetical protein